MIIFEIIATFFFEVIFLELILVVIQNQTTQCLNFEELKSEQLMK